MGMQKLKIGNGSDLLEWLLGFGASSINKLIVRFRRTVLDYHFRAI